MSQKPRRARGTGSIRFDAKRGVWVGRVPVGTYPAGRTKYAEVSHKSQAEVARLMRTAAPAAPETATVRTWAERWLGALSVRPSTAASYRHSFEKHLYPLVGHVRLAALTPSKVEELAAQLKARGLAPNTVLRTLAHLRACL